MDATAQTTDKLHRVKRAYTKKAVVTKEPNVRAEGADVGVQYDDEVAVPHPVNLARVESKAQAYALRVWGGQSPDVRPAERLDRVRAALAGQNLSADGVMIEGCAL